MKIGIITHWWCNENYGQQLQAFALQKVLRDEGHRPFLIRYRPKSTGRRLLARAVSRPQLILKRVFKRIPADKGRHNQIALRRFNVFKEKYIVSTPSSFTTYRELAASRETDAECYICGSDQVWNENFVMHDKHGWPWFLAFGFPHAKRVAYAPSFGANSVSRGYCKFIAPLLQQLNAVSVREVTGVDICKAAGRNDALHVLDPTLLLNRAEYVHSFEKESCTDYSKEAFALCYILKTSDKHIPFEEIKTFCRDQGLGLLVVSVYGSFDEISQHEIHPTIPEWIKLIDNAKVVFTNSFHGTAFSIICNTPFVSIKRDTGPVGMNSRIESLLGSLGLTQQMWPGDKSMSEMAKNSLDWVSVSKRLETIRALSLQYLISSLSN